MLINPGHYQSCLAMEETSLKGDSGLRNMPSYSSNKT